MTNDTIAAISTAPGEAGISIIRVSGPESLEIADRVFTCPPPAPSQRPDRTLMRGTIRTGESVIDEVIVLIMRAPHSYTREDVIEIQGHGGLVSARRVLRCLLESGARPAEPGEFTKRAFLSGRIDLVQAEAVLDLIRARSDRAAQSAIEQLEGGLSASFNDMYQSLVAAARDLEVWLDFSEDGTAPDSVSAVLERLVAVQLHIQRTLDTWDEGHVLREGALVVISGKPNVGKSSLLNCLLQANRAIVSVTPGTTRDTIEETMIMDGIPIRLVDTAGLRHPQSDVEAEGLERALDQLRAADLCAHMLDSSQPLDADDRSALNHLRPAQTLVVLNKTDLGQMVHPIAIQGLPTISISCVSKTGIDELKRALVEKLGFRHDVPARATISERHRNMLLKARNHIADAVATLKRSCEEELILAASDIRDAGDQIALLTGRVYDDDILDSLFSEFCIGK